MDLNSPAAVSAALIEILRNDLNLDMSRVSSDSRLVDDLGLDSVALAVGMVAIEDNLGVVLSEEELFTADTLGELERVVISKLPEVQSD